MSNWILSITLALIAIFNGEEPASRPSEAVVKDLRTYIKHPTDKRRAELTSVPLEQLLELLPQALPWKNRKLRKQGKVPLLDTFYVYQLPKNYTDKRAWPLIISMHGNPPRHYKRVHYEYWKGDPAKAGYILVSPSLEGGLWHRSGEPIIIGALKDAVRRFRVDPDRIYINGYSSGGSGAWIFATRFADLFAGMIVRCGIRRPSNRELKNLKHRGVYVIHAAQDKACPVDQARRAVRALKHLKVTHFYKEFPYGHDFYPRQNMDVLKYMGKYANPAPTSIDLYAEFRHERRIAGYLSVTGKFHHVQAEWEGNTVTIEFNHTKDLKQVDLYLRKDLLKDAKELNIRFNETIWQSVPVQRSSNAFLKALALNPWVDDASPERVFVGGFRILHEGKLLKEPVPF